MRSALDNQPLHLRIDQVRGQMILETGFYEKEHTTK